MKRALRWIGIGLGAVVGLALIAGIVLYAIGSSRVSRSYEVQTAALNLVSDSAGLARGEHLTRIFGCTECHTANFGGQVFTDEPPFRIVASNLTRGEGGVADQYTSPELFDRAIRHGVGADGKSLLVMPAKAFHNVSDDDIAHIISYLMQVPPVDNVLPATKVKPLGRLLSAFALDPTMEVNMEPARASAPPVGPTADFGQYYASTICAYCHGDDLRGMQPPNPSSPPAPDIVAAAGRWTAEQFVQTLRTGITPEGRQLNPEFMPWPMTAQATDDELRGLHVYLAGIRGGD